MNLTSGRRSSGESANVDIDEIWATQFFWSLDMFSSVKSQLSYRLELTDFSTEKNYVSNHLHTYFLIRNC